MASATPCHCPEINDQDWHLKDQTWNGKFFYFDTVRYLFNTPLSYDKTLAEMKRDIARKGYQFVNPDMVLNSPGMFQGRIMMEIQDPEQYDANVENVDNARMLSRVCRGSRGNLGNAVEELRAFTQDRTHLDPIVMYYWYITCNKCSRTRGYEKTVLFARV
jgi:hypothetical protein